METKPTVVPFSDHHICIPDGRKHYVFDQRNIKCAKGDGNYTDLHLVNPSRVVKTCKTLQQIAAVLSPALFCRCHRSYIVNKEMIMHYTLEDGGWLTLLDGAEVPISKAFGKHLLEGLKMIEPC